MLYSRFLLVTCFFIIVYILSIPIAQFMPPSHPSLSPLVTVSFRTASSFHQRELSGCKMHSKKQHELTYFM